MNEILIDKCKIGNNFPIFLIAEAGVNHNGKISLAKKLIDVAVEANVDAIKFQTFKTKEVFITSTPKPQYQISNEKDKESFDEMARKFEFSEKDFKNLKKYCDDKGIIFLSTPYGASSVELLESLNVPAFKISSGDLNNYPLLKLIGSKNKPILLSTGMATLKEVKETVSFLSKQGSKNLIIFQCTTNYPAEYEELNLNVIDTFLKEFQNYIIGFSDHSKGIEASIGAAAKGVKVIEKHFTLDKEMEGPDHQASLNPGELKEWVKSIRIIEKSLGTYSKFPTASEKNIAKIARRSIVSLKDLNIGHVITIQDIGVKRPGTGIPPKFFDDIVGKKVKNFIENDTIITWDDLE